MALPVPTGMGQELNPARLNPSCPQEPFPVRGALSPGQPDGQALEQQPQQP